MWYGYYILLIHRPRHMIVGRECPIMTTSLSLVESKLDYAQIARPMILVIETVYQRDLPETLPDMTTMSLSVIQFLLGLLFLSF